MSEIISFDKFRQKQLEKEIDYSNVTVHAFIPLSERKAVLNQGYHKSIKVATMFMTGTNDLSGTWVDLASNTEYKNIAKLIEQGRDKEYIEKNGKTVQVSLDLTKLGLSENEIKKLMSNELVTLSKGFKATAIKDIDDGEDIELDVEDYAQDYFTSLAFEKFKKWASRNIPKEENLSLYFLRNADYSFELGGKGLTALTINGNSIL